MSKKSNIVVLREPSFLIVTNPVQKYHPIQMNFLGKKLSFDDQNLIFFLGQILLKIIFLDDKIKGVDFTIDDSTEAYFACSIVFKGETLVLGGKRKYNQVSFQISLTILIFEQFSKLESCGLKYEEDLPFTKNLYAQVYCGVYNFKRGIYKEPTETALICRHQQCFT